jgi:hypothetical protein
LITHQIASAGWSPSASIRWGLRGVEADRVAGRQLIRLIAQDDAQTPADNERASLVRLSAARTTAQRGPAARDPFAENSESIEIPSSAASARRVETDGLAASHSML